MKNLGGDFSLLTSVLKHIRRFGNIIKQYFIISTRILSAPKYLYLS